MELSKILIRVKNLCDLLNISIDSDKMYDIISKNISSILEFIKPCEIGLSISDEKSFDIFIKYKNYQIYYNIFFENEIENIWLDIYENKNSICSYDGSSEDALKILKIKIDNTMETQNLKFPNFTQFQTFAINEFTKLLNDKNLKFVKDFETFIYYVSNNEKLKTLEIAKDFITISCDSKNKTALLNVYEYSNDLNYSEIANIFLDF